MRAVAQSSGSLPAASVLQAACSLAMRSRLYAAATRKAAIAVLAFPMNLDFRIPPTDFIQPYTSSMSFRFRWLTA